MTDADAERDLGRMRGDGTAVHRASVATRRGLAWALTVVVMTTLVACGGNPGDPGNKRLEALRSDPAFELIPPGGEHVGEDAARPADTLFLSDNYFGPYAGRTFRLSGSFSEALEFYDERLPDLGWRRLSPGLNKDGEEVYSKQFGSWEATLSLSMIDTERQLLIISATAPAVEQEPR